MEDARFGPEISSASTRLRRRYSWIWTRPTFNPFQHCYSVISSCEYIIYPTYPAPEPDQRHCTYKHTHTYCIAPSSTTHSAGTSLQLLPTSTTIPLIVMNRAAAAAPRLRNLPDSGLGRAEKTFTRTAQLALLYWLLKYVVLDGWRFLWAKGLTGAGKDVYLQLKNVSSPSTSSLGDSSYTDGTS